MLFYLTNHITFHSHRLARSEAGCSALVPLTGVQAIQFDVLQMLFGSLLALFTELRCKSMISAR
jgi:hypothetical protein